MTKMRKNMTKPEKKIKKVMREFKRGELPIGCLLYTSPSPRDVEESRMPSSA